MFNPDIKQEILTQCKKDKLCIYWCGHKDKCVWGKCIKKHNSEGLIQWLKLLNEI
ncbi:MAG: hypothetical protein ACFFDF_00465 [Candidatus Odinarchaeota archaeon]